MYRALVLVALLAGPAFAAEPLTQAEAARLVDVPASLTFHRHHRSMKTLGPAHEEFLLERNALFTIYKNYDEDSLRVAFPAALLLAARRGTVRGGDDTGVLDPQRGAPAAPPAGSPRSCRPSGS